ncbi:hypothetical protein Sango_1059000 [Sesamum angolense]|uniref:Reverse transcriptase RNase H-like domain-containing protein n=1 Tax=Sesamum angolense TaxID=2727404 RepID=A0AAE1X1G5_9LAMI|nr:hypothetical protein Sango_1059000 [Sesamum angolense]
MAARYIEEIKFPEWLSGVIVVPKPGGKWRMCIDLRGTRSTFIFPLHLKQSVPSSSVKTVESKMPIYYVSKVLNKAKGQYTPIEKMTLTLVITARRLCYYFLSYPLRVKMNMPLKQILRKPNIFQKLVKWTVELSEYDISYLPGTTIKAQALAYFVLEMTRAPMVDTSRFV